MQCEYCDSFITPYPSDGLCPNCGAKLPPQEVPAWQPPVPMPPVQPEQLLCCSRCGSTDLLIKKRGFSWGLAILGLFILPPYGLLLGFIGRNKQVAFCQSCHRHHNL